MKKQLPFLFILLLTSLLTRAQLFPGSFVNNLNQYYYGSGTPSCAVDSSFFLVRFGGVERYMAPQDSVSYLWARFYPATTICAAPSSSVAVLKGGSVYQYFVKNDSMVNTSTPLTSTVRDISSSPGAIWAAVGFDDIGRYDSSGWNVISLNTTFDPQHIIAQSDSSAYVADNVSIRLYTPSGTSPVLFTFAVSNSLKEWSVDTSGNLWLLSYDTLRMISPSGNVNVWDHSNSLLNSNTYFTHITSDGKGTIWANTSDNNLYRYRGNSWGSYTITLPEVIYGMAADNVSGAVYLYSWDSVYVAPNGLFTQHLLPDWPYQHIKAVSVNKIATEQGIFTTNNTVNPYVTPTNFQDSIMIPYASDVTCFITGDQTYGYGTHHGVFGTTANINNATLPDTNINYLYSASGSYYIGTDKGLCIYNQVVYTTFDTSNSGLPSNKVTFIISYASTYTGIQELWVGTDKGVALYTNGVWSRFDTSVVHLPSFNVTGILPCPFVYYNADSTVWVSTLGSGLIKLKRDSSFRQYCTANGLMKDDSLYYVTQANGCNYSSTSYIGTGAHGIAYYNAYADTFSYVQTAYIYPDRATFNSSKLFCNTSMQYQYRGQTVFVTDNGIDYIPICYLEGLNETQTPLYSLKWYQETDDKLRIELPQTYSGYTDYQLYDLSGRVALSTTLTASTDHKAYLDISALTAGVYILHTTNGANSTRTKIMLSK